jgi:pyruvate formate lyase activating enzyme
MIKRAILFEKLANENVRCLACAHKCIIRERKTGICGVRKNIDGELYLLVYGKIASLAVDPIEKKPIYHFLPSSKSLSIGTVGCNFKCKWCQNYEISQASKEGNFFGKEKTPEEIIELAIKNDCKSISYTYNEPTIFLEFVKDTAELARKKGIKNIMVTNGYFSEESFEFIAPYIDAMNIDLKSITPQVYEKYCGAKLKPVLESIKKVHAKGIHLEITTLVIPGVNDSEKELKKIAEFISSINKKIPWHISRFFPRYKMKDTPFTPRKILEKAYEIGKKEKLEHVHIGNA